MKPLSNLAIIIIAISLFFASCSKEPPKIPVEKITLSQTAITLNRGQRDTLSATIFPDDATDKTIIWTSSNDKVAFVDNGVVISPFFSLLLTDSAISLGNAVITAKAGEKTATCSVTVVATPVTSITLDQTSIEIMVGQQYTSLYATVYPADATYRRVYWTSSDESVASVNGGTVTGLKIGNATITAKAGGMTATCSVIVTTAPVTTRHP